jgi:hypothetical protein
MKINTLRCPLISVPSVSVLPMRSYTSTSSACDSSSRVSGVRELLVVVLKGSEVMEVIVALLISGPRPLVFLRDRIAMALKPWS